jgi:hypothetical protein
MGPTRIRGWMSRTEHRLAVLLAVLGLAAGVVVHHTAPAHAGMHQGDHGMAAQAMCLGTVPGAVAIVGLLVVAAVRRRRPPRPARVRHAVVAALRPVVPQPRARSSPLFLQLEVIRR